MMTESGLTPKEYELHLQDLRDRARAFLASGEGNIKQLLHDAESVLELGEEFPDVLERYGEVPGLVAGLLARRQQREVMGTPAAGRESAGCLLGWLKGRGK